MSRKRKKFVRKKSKYEDQAILVQSVITEIIEHNKEYPDGRIKNVFRCKSSKIPEGRLCIKWGRTILEAGCEFQAKGRIVENYGNEVFLVWSMMILKRPEGIGNG